MGDFWGFYLGAPLKMGNAFGVVSWCPNSLDGVLPWAHSVLVSVRTLHPDTALRLLEVTDWGLLQRVLDSETVMLYIW